MKSKITVIIGATASGKSDYAIQLAQKINVRVTKVDILKNQIDLELVKETETDLDVENEKEEIINLNFEVDK